ncbi:hypothetical protein BDY17DRAFT_245057 [Neohortaea acidophila]|uniref:Uncharacterized protein n=1 Tax=Neohortaea acidophila TaxID=245834 RepID=A0A6A6Q3K1_9PEZI|nr:uncharacterized protein BDY17DRAFT_245057 [Neohortaea acidophila]KAF2485997.1 hypothetical protein BDY17DRAFT_245057 [Neohortaea acidophila]
MEEPQPYDLLAAEIDRVVTSVYPTQLKHLRDVVCMVCTDLDVDRWVLSRPCQIPALADRILAALPHWPYVLGMLTRLARNVKMRDAFLLRQPTLLYDCVVHAVQSGDTDSRYNAAAVTLLSHPLPSTIALPSDCQNLVIRLFDHAARAPTVSSIRPIYQILKGTSTMLLGILSSGVLLRFEDHLFNIVRNLKGDDQSLSLYCLAIMKILATASEEQLCGTALSSYDTQELLASTQPVSASKWKPDTVRQYFTERKAQKTMQLVVLRVMWACTPTTGDSLDEKLESLRLANEIIVAVPPHERQTWRKANALVPKKFEEKVLSPALEPVVRFHALCFLLRLAEGGPTPPGVVDGLRKIVVNVDDITKVVVGDDTAVAQSLIHSAVFDASTNTTLVQNIVDFAADSGSSVALESYNRLAFLLQQMNAGIDHQETIIEGVMLALDVLACGNKLRKLHQLIRLSPKDLTQPTHTGACAQTVQEARRILIHELCAIFLKASLHSANSTYSISRDTLSMLLELHASSANPLKCGHHAHYQLATSTPLPFVEAIATPADSNTDWRQQLKSEMQSRTSTDVERLEAMFAKACAELEDHCDNVERPLQEEREKLKALQEKYDELNQAYAALENESIDRNIRFDALEMERDQCLTDLDAVREENERFEGRTCELKRRLEDADAATIVQRNDSKRTLERLELEHAAVLACKVEEIEDLQSQTRGLEEEVVNKERAVQKACTDVEEALSSVAELQAKLDELRGEKEVRDGELALISKSRDDAEQKAARFEAQVAELQTTLAAAETTYQSNARQMQVQAMQDQEAARSMYDQQLAELTAKHNEMTEGLQLQLAEAEEAFLRLQEHRESDTRQHESRMDVMQKKLDRLTRKCEEKDHQIAEAEAMRSKINDFIALGKQFQTAPQPPAAEPLRRSRRSSAAPPTQHQPFEEDPSPPTPFSTNDHLQKQQQQMHQDASFASNPSSTESRNGPTPKRPRPRRSFRIAAASPAGSPHTIRSVRTSNAAARTTRASISTVGRRQPLLSVSANQSPAKRVGRSAKRGVVTKMQEVEDESFGGSELFAGTPAAGRGVCEGLLDDTTEL